MSRLLSCSPTDRPEGRVCFGCRIDSFVEVLFRRGGAPGCTEAHVKRQVTRHWHMVAIAVALSALLVLDAHLHAQGPSVAPGGATRTWVQQRTAWGHPDLQGVWNNSTTTPLEQRTREEIEQGRRAEEPVRAATDGTGAVRSRNWETPPAAVASGRSARRQDSDDARGRRAARRARTSARAYRGEADSWLDRNSWERCITRSMPTAMIPNFYNANYQIFQTPDHVAILIEMIHETRIIPLDKRPHVSSDIRQWLGDSRGHWEGDTLVVETTNFNDRLDGGALQPSHVIQTGYRGSGETLRLVERFTRTSATTIDYRFTVEDPVTFAKPYTVALPMRKNNAQDRIYGIRLSRGELRDGQHPQLRARRRKGRVGGGDPRSASTDRIRTSRRTRAGGGLRPLRTPVEMRPAPSPERPGLRLPEPGLTALEVASYCSTSQPIQLSRRALIVVKLDLGLQPAKCERATARCDASCNARESRESSPREERQRRPVGNVTPL